MFKIKLLRFTVNMLLITALCLSFGLTCMAEEETIAPLQKFIVYSIALDESARVEVAEVVETIITVKNKLDDQTTQLLPHFPDMTYDELRTALSKCAVCTKDGITSLCDLILFGPTTPQYSDKMPNIISNINYNIIGDKNDNRGSTFFYSLLKAYNLYTIFGGNPHIATNMSDLPGLVDIDMNGLSYEIAKRVSTAIGLMPSLEQTLESYGQTTMMGNLLKMSEECANDEATEEIYYFKVSLDECGAFYGNWPSMKGNEKFDGLTFRDIDNCSWAHPAIKNLSENGIINGYDKYRFGPSNNITREQFVKIVVTALNIDTSTSTDAGFTDVDKTAWYYPYICAAYDNKIVNGETQTVFGVGNPITREQMATIIYRAYSDAGVSFNPTETKRFSDSSKVSSYAKEAVEKMSSCGVITGMGDGRFAPKDFASRAQASVMIDRVENLKH